MVGCQMMETWISNHTVRKRKYVAWEQVIVAEPGQGAVIEEVQTGHQATSKTKKAFVRSFVWWI